MKLKGKQFLFCEHYIQTSNGTLSARLAGYKGNDATLASVACENLRKPKIRDYLRERYQEVAMSSDEVLMRLADIARANLSDYCDDDGTIDWKKVHKHGYAFKSLKKGSKLEFESKL